MLNSLVSANYALLQELCSLNAVGSPVTGLGVSPQVSMREEITHLALLAQFF